MLLIITIIIIIVNAVTFRREFKNQIIRVFLFILLYYLQTSAGSACGAPGESEVIGIYQSIFHSIGILRVLPHILPGFIYMQLGVVELRYQCKNQNLNMGNRTKICKILLCLHTFGVKIKTTLLPGGVLGCFAPGIRTLHTTANSGDSSSDVTPVVIYNNADSQKELIMKSNRKKAGVYR